MPHVLKWLESEQPDLLALQETKVRDEDFPWDTFADRGYTATFSGQSGYNGVAILSREPPKDVVHGIGNGFADEQRRVASAQEPAVGIHACDAIVRGDQRVEVLTFGHATCDPHDVLVSRNRGLRGVRVGGLGVIDIGHAPDCGHSGDSVGGWAPGAQPIADVAGLDKAQIDALIEAGVVVQRSL